MRRYKIMSLAFTLAAVAGSVLPTTCTGQESCKSGNCFANMCHKMLSRKARQTVYLCRSEKLYFNKDAAKQLKYLDPQGNALVKTSKIPEDFRDGSDQVLKPRH